MERRLRLTVLSDMAGLEWLGPFGHRTRAMLKQARDWGLDDIDLKTVCRKNVIDLNNIEVAQVARALADASVGVEAFSTYLFKRRIEDGPKGFRDDLVALERALAIAKTLKPRRIRLLGADLPERGAGSNSVSYIKAHAPWLLDLYGEAVDMIADAGIEATIENETHGCLFSRPDEVLDFFAALDRGQQLRFTWDVQNMWAMGVAPSRAVYRQLASVIGYVHLKGGRAAPDSPALAYRSALQEADWPVEEIVSDIIADGIVEAVCLNPPLGATAPGSNIEDVTVRDIAFLRQRFSALASKMPAPPVVWQGATRQIKRAASGR